MSEKTPLSGSESRKQQQPEERDTPLSALSAEQWDQVMGRLWTAMSEMFGADTWGRKYGEKPTGEWYRSLAGKTADHIAQGIERCKQARLRFPPTLPEFLEFCRPEDSWPVASYSSPPPVLPRGSGASGVLEHLAKGAKSEVAKRELEKCRAILRGEPVDLSGNPPIRVGGKLFSPGNTSAHRRFADQQQVK